MLEAFLKESGAAERVDELLAAAIDEVAANEQLTPEFIARAKTAVFRGMFDGSVARARASTSGSLGTFGTALRRIREMAGYSHQQMAARAEVTPDLWKRLEEQRISPKSIETRALTSVVEAVQLKPSDLRATLRRSESVRALPVGQASFRADPVGNTDAAASYEDLVAAVADESPDAMWASNNEEIDAIVERVTDELRRRGRTDLL